MRLTLFLPTLALFSLFPLLAYSISPRTFSNRKDHAHSPAASLIASRQYRFPRDLLDVCINVNANLLADASQLLGLSSLLGALNLGTNIELCLCLKDLDIYLETNDSIQALIGILGKNTVGALITALINTSPEARHCTFPQHAHHTCNTSDPCRYACDPPYVSDGDQCICAFPHMSCNGVCDIFPHGCGSAVPRALTQRSHSIVTLAQAQASCKSEESVCGIAGREKTLSFECLDTSSTKDSCGGCATPHPFFESHPLRQSSGTDCSTILNAKDAVCSSSRCVVKTCDEGWIPSPDKRSCIPVLRSGLKMLKVRKPSEIIADSDSTTDINSLITSVVKLVIALNIHAPGTQLIDSTGPSSVTDLTNIDAVYNLLDGINAATSGLVSSSAVPLASTYSTTLLDTCALLRSTVDGCNCIQSLGIESFSDDLNKLIISLNNLQAACTENPNANLIPSASAVGTTTAAATTPTTTNPSGNAIVVGLTTLLSGAGIQGKSGAVVDNLVSSDTAKSVNGLLDNLGLGPANYRRQVLPPLTAIVNTSIGGNSHLLSQVTVVVNLITNLAGSVDPSSSSTSPGPLVSELPASPPSSTPLSLIPSTGSLVSSLSTCLIDPILFGSLYRDSLNLVNSPDLLTFCKNSDLLYASECNLHELFNDCAYVDELGLGDLLADLLLALDETQYLVDWCSTGTNSGNGVTGHSRTSISIPGTTTVVPTISVTTSSSRLPTTSTISTTVASIITTGSGSSSIAISSSISSQTHTLATSVSSASYIQTSSAITTSTNAPLTSTFSAAAPSETPIIVSLDDILSNLGLNETTAEVTVDGLGDQVNAPVNQILNGLGIGPLNVKGRTPIQNELEQRQIIANANAIVDLSGLGGAIAGLVDLVLNLKSVGNGLPAAPTSTSALPAPAAISPLTSPPLGIPGVLAPSTTLVDQALVDNVLTTTLALLSLSSPTYSQFLQGLEQVIQTSTQSMNIISGCSCTSAENSLDEVYGYLSDIVKATQELENLCHDQAVSSTATATPSTNAAGASSSAAQSSSGDESIIIGLTKLLKGLGLDIDGDVVVDHLLSDDVDHTVNTILNSIGIGPVGARRAFSRDRSDW